MSFASFNGACGWSARSILFPLRSEWGRRRRCSLHCRDLPPRGCSSSLLHGCHPGTHTRAVPAPWRHIRRLPPAQGQPYSAWSNTLDLDDTRARPGFIPRFLCGSGLATHLAEESCGPILRGRASPQELRYRRAVAPGKYRRWIRRASGPARAQLEVNALSCRENVPGDAPIHRRGFFAEGLPCGPNMRIRMLAARVRWRSVMPPGFGSWNAVLGRGATKDPRRSGIHLNSRLRYRGSNQVWFTSACHMRPLGFGRAEPPCPRSPALEN
jgi:hypothetical protein